MEVNLTKLKDAASAALNGIDPNDYSDPVNWAALRCVSAIKCVDEEETIWYEVIVAEASQMPIYYRLA